MSCQLRLGLREITLRAARGRPVLVSLHKKFVSLYQTWPSWLSTACCDVFGCLLYMKEEPLSTHTAKAKWHSKEIYTAVAEWDNWILPKPRNVNNGGVRPGIVPGTPFPGELSVQQESTHTILRLFGMRKCAIHCSGMFRQVCIIPFIYICSTPTTPYLVCVYIHQVTC